MSAGANLQPQHLHLHNGGDGTSASSVGTASPEMFHSPGSSSAARHDVIVTSKDLSIHSGDSGLVVRGSSLIAVGVTNPLTRMSPVMELHLDKSVTSTSDIEHSPVDGVVSPHSSAAVALRAGLTADSAVSSDDDYPKLTKQYFVRTSPRQSLGSNPALLKWLDAQEKAQAEGSGARVDPIGGSSSPQLSSKMSDQENSFDDDELVLVIDNKPGSNLGITVKPVTDDLNRFVGLELQKVATDGCISEDGRLRPMDRILEINGSPLRGLSFAQAQEIFRDAARSPLLRLRVQPYRAEMELCPPEPAATVERRKAPPPPLHPKPVMSRPEVSVQGGTLSAAADAAHSQLGLSSPPRSGAPPPPPQRSPKTQLTTSTSPQKTADSELQEPEESSKSAKSVPGQTPSRDRNVTNVRTIGRKLALDLVKGPDGLGFSVTSRDNPTGGPNPIYVKNILKKGAAIRDGRLRAGDRLLQVDGLELTGKQQAETVSILRAVPVGATVRLLVSRPEDSPEPAPEESEPAPTNGPEVDTEPGAPNTGQEDCVLISMDIPLQDAASTGLGVSVKGRTAEDGSQDAGVYIKCVIPSGAAYLDGRLQENDQLITINGETLENIPNKQAMEVLRRNMRSANGPVSGCVRLVIARRHTVSTHVSGRTPSTHTVNSIGSSGGQSVTISAEVHDTPSSPRVAPVVLNGPVSTTNIMAPAVMERIVRGDNQVQMRGPVAPLPPPFRPLPPESTGFGGGLPLPLPPPPDPVSMWERDDSPPPPPPPPPPHQPSHHHNPTFYATQALEGVLVRPFGRAAAAAADGPSGSSRSLGQLPLLPDRPSVPGAAAGPHAIRRSGPIAAKEGRKKNMQRRSASLENMLRDSDEESGQPATSFNREGVGRRSMSEKRHAHVDAKQFDFYKQLKADKEELDRQYHTLPSRLRAAKQRQQQQKQAQALTSAAPASTSTPSTPVPLRQQLSHATSVPYLASPRPEHPPSYLNVMKSALSASQGHLSSCGQARSSLKKAVSMESVQSGSAHNGRARSSSVHRRSTHSSTCSDNEERQRGADTPDSCSQSDVTDSDLEDGSNQFVRSRPTNNSFRQAVDKSYDNSVQRRSANEHHTEQKTPDAKRRHSGSGPAEEKHKLSMKKKFLKGLFRLGRGRPKGSLGNSPRPPVTAGPGWKAGQPGQQAEVPSVRSDAETRVLAWQAQNAAALSATPPSSPAASGPNDLNRATHIQALRANHQLAHAQRGHQFPDQDDDTLSRPYENMFLNVADTAPTTRRPPPPPPPTILRNTENAPPPPPPPPHRPVSHYVVGDANAVYAQVTRATSRPTYH